MTRRGRTQTSMSEDEADALAAAIEAGEMEFVELPRDQWPTFETDAAGRLRLRADIETWRRSGSD